MRTIKQLLQLMLENQNLFYTGMCSWTDYLFNKKKISIEKNRLLIQYIKENRPFKFSSIGAWKNKDSGFYWEYGNINPRIKWIKKHINKNK